MHNIDTDYKIGGSTDQTWAGIYGYRPETTEEMEAAGMLLASIRMASEIDFDLANIAALLQDELQEKYYKASQTSPSNIAALEVALKAMKSRLEDILHREPELAKTGIDLELAVAVVKDNLLSIAVVGESKVYIGRGEELHEISEALIDPDLSGYMFTGSLELQPDDRVLLTTHKIPLHNSLQSMQEQMDEFSIEGLAVKGGAALLIGFDVNWRNVEVLEAENREEELEELMEAKPVAADADNKVMDLELEEEAFTDPVPETFEFESDEVVRSSETPVSRLSDNKPRFETNVPRLDFKGNLMSVREKIVPLLITARETAGRLASSAKEKSADFVQQVEESGVLQTTMEKVKTGSLAAKDFVVSKAKSIKNGEPGDRYARRVPTRGGYGTYSGGTGVVNRIKLIAIGNGDNKQTRYLAAAGIILLVVVGVGINRSYEARQLQEQIDSLTAQTVDLENEFVEIKASATAAALSNNASQKGQVLGAISELKSEVETLQEEELLTEDLEARLADILAETVTAEDQALKIESFTQPSLIADLATEFQDSDASALAISGSSIFVTDEQRGVIYKLANKQSSDLDVLVEDLEEPYLIETDADGNLVVFDRSSSDSVIANVNAETGELIRQLGLSRESQGEIVAMDIWSNGSLYAISPERQALIKQPDVAGSFQIPDYNNPWRRDQDFATAVDMVVDYWIYVVIDGQGIKRYLSGEPSQLTIQGLLADDKTALQNATAITTTERRVYVADPENRRVLSFVKDLNDENVITYEGQYKYRGDSTIFSQISDLVVTPNENQIIVLDGNRVIRLDRATF